MSNSTTSNALYYQPDSKAPPLGIAICLFLAIAIGLIGGLIYAYASWYNPFVYIQIIITGGFGLLIGFTMDWGFKWGKVRGFMNQKLLALLAALIAFYCAWAIWEALVLEQSPFSLLLHPVQVWKTSRIFNMLGLWSIAGDTPVTGILLYVFWALEAAIIIGVAFFKADESRPFSVAGNNWAKETKLFSRLPMADPTAFKKALEEKNYDALLALERGDEATNHTKLIMYDCEGSDDYFLHAQLVVFEPNDDGKMEAKPYDVTKFIRLEPEIAQQLLAAG